MINAPVGTLSSSPSAKGGQLFKLMASSVHVLCAAIVLLMVYTLKTFLSPTAPLVKWRTFALHPLLMALAFGFFGPLASIAWRVYGEYLGMSRQATKLTHLALATSAVVLGTLGIIDMWQVHAGGAEAQVAKGWAVHFQSSHSWIGMIGMCVFAYQWLGGIVLFLNPFVPHKAQSASKPTHAVLGAISLYATLLSIITGILSLAYRGDNRAPKDVLFKVIATLTFALSIALLLLFAAKRPSAPSNAVANSAHGASASAGRAAERFFLNKRRQSLVLAQRFELSHDVVRFRFHLPPSTPVLGLPVGQHLKVYATNTSRPSVQGLWNGRPDEEANQSEIERKYTPTTSDDEHGYVDLVIKVYKGGVIDRFPDGGKMSQYMHRLSVGDTLDVSGPWGGHEYLGGGVFRTGGGTVRARQIGMMAGGTGITPMLQIIAAVLKENGGAVSRLSLLYANQTEDDILVRKTLEDLQRDHPEIFSVWYTVDRPPGGWAYSSGFIDAEMISERLPPPGDETLVLMCGPPPMVKFACQANLDKLGYAKERQIVF